MQITVAPWSSVSKEPEEVEQSPNGRYIRYNILLGKGACKRVYKALDTEEGTEVAWNQVDLLGMDRDEEARQHLQEEIRVLQKLKHKNIMTFYAWWYDKNNLHINFITELFTAGNLRQYRKKLKIMSENVLKRWAHQILEGLLYLHGHTPPIVHRDLKCDNIFVNSATGEVKIGDLGLATVQQTAMSVVGTPEFMAPEVYDESYDERCDIYSFGMCLLELATLEYPYAECHSVPQIFKKVTLGIPPASLTRVSSPELRDFISLCIAHNPADRPSARDLLKHTYLECIRHGPDTSSAPHPLLASAGPSSGALANGVGSGGAGCGSSSGTGWSTPTGSLHCAASVRDLREALHQQETLARHQQQHHQQHPHGHPHPHLPLQPHLPAHPHGHLPQNPSPGTAPFTTHHSCPDAATSPEVTAAGAAAVVPGGLLPRSSLVLNTLGSGLLRSPSQPSPLGRTTSRAAREDSVGSPAAALLAQVSGPPPPSPSEGVASPAAETRRYTLTQPPPSPFLMAALPHNCSEGGSGEGGAGTGSGAVGARSPSSPAGGDPLTMVARRLVRAGEISAGGATTPSSDNYDSDSDSDQEVLVPIEVLKAGLLEEGFVESESVHYFPTTPSGGPCPPPPAPGDPGYDPASTAPHPTSAHTPLHAFPNHLFYPHQNQQQQQQQLQQVYPGQPQPAYEEIGSPRNASVTETQRVCADKMNVQYDVKQQQQHRSVAASVQKQYTGSMLGCCYGDSRVVPAFSNQFSEGDEEVEGAGSRANERREETQAAGGIVVVDPRQMSTWSCSDSSSSTGNSNKQLARVAALGGGHSRTGSAADSVTFSVLIPPGASGTSTPMLRESYNGESPAMPPPASQPPLPPAPLPPPVPSSATPPPSLHGPHLSPTAPATAPLLRAGSRGDGPTNVTGIAALGKVKLPSFRNRVLLIQPGGDGERRCIRTTSARTFGGSTMHGREAGPSRHAVPCRTASNLALSAGGCEALRSAAGPPGAVTGDSPASEAVGGFRRRVARSSSLPLSLTEMEQAAAGGGGAANCTTSSSLLATGDAGNLANVGADGADIAPAPDITAHGPLVPGATGRNSVDNVGEGSPNTGIPPVLMVPAFFLEDAVQGQGRGVHLDSGPLVSKTGLLPVHAPCDSAFASYGGQEPEVAVAATAAHVGEDSGGVEPPLFVAPGPRGEVPVVREYARPIHGVIMRLKQWKRLVKDRKKGAR